MGVAAYNRGSKVIRDSIRSPDAPRSLTDSVQHPVDTSPTQPIRRSFVVGETVYCVVTALRGQAMKVTDVRGDRVKVEGSRAWCPAYNFRRELTPHRS